MRVHINDNRSDDEYIYKDKNKSNDRCNSVILIVNIIGLTLLTIFILFGQGRLFFLRSGNSGGIHLDPVIPSLTPDVHHEIEELFTLLLSNTGIKAANITDNEENLLGIIFDAYDVDDDGRWSLQEFQMFMDDILDEKTAFHKLDVNGDGILSFREVVACLQHLHYIPMIQQYLRNEMATPIQAIFEYSYHTDRDGDNKVDQIWFEYAAQFLFWDYDPNQDGYITFDEWVYHQTSDTWFIFDLDGDSEVTFDEFKSGFIAGGFMDAKEKETIHSIFDLQHPVPRIDEAEVNNIVLLTNTNEIYQLITDENGVVRRLFIGAVKSAWNDASNKVSTTWNKATTSEKVIMGVGGAVAVGGVVVAVAVLGPVVVGGGAVAGGTYAVVGAEAVETGAAIAVAARALTVSVIGARVAVAGAISAGTKQCFGENNAIYTANRGYILIKDLMVNDYVLSGIDNQYSKVWVIDEHNHEEDPYALLVRLWFNENDFITVTPDHLVYTMNDEISYLIRAAEFNAGDELIALKQDNYTHSYVIKTDHVLEKTRNPVTMNGDIVVNGILASSYAYSIQNAHRLHHSATLFRWISNNINGQFAAIFAHFSKNVVFKAFQFFGFETIFDYYYTVSIMFASVSVFVMLFVISLTKSIKNHNY